MLSSRMRKASTSPSSRAPSGVAVPVRRATCPSTASRTSATMHRVTSAVTGTARLNESATRPATPATSTARVSVTQSAGCRNGWSLRMRAAASSAAAARPVASPAIQPATARPAVADTTPSRAAVASVPRSDARRIVGRAASSAGLASSSAVPNLVLVRGLNRTHRASVPAAACRRFQRGNGSAVTPVHRGRPHSCAAVAAGRLNYGSGRPV